MKKIIYVITVVILLTGIDIEAQQIQWENTITSGPQSNQHSSRDIGVAILPLPNGGCILLGTSTGAMGNDKSEDGFFHPVGPNIRREDYWVMRLDANGQIIWENTIGGTFADVAKTMILTNDGNLVIAGSSGSNMSQDKSEDAVNTNIPSATDYWIVKMNIQGNILWDKTIGGSQTDDLSDILELPNGDLLLVGHSVSGIGVDKSEPNLGEQDFWVVCISSNGSVKWDRTYGGIARDFLRSATVVNNSVVLVGASNSPKSRTKSEDNIQGSFDIWAVGIDPVDGNVLWENTIGGEGYDDATSAVFINGNQILVGGTSDSKVSADKTVAGYGGTDVWLVGLKTDGTVSFDNVYGTSGSEQTVKILADGTRLYLAVNSTSNADFDRCFTYGFDDIWLMELDFSRNIIWEEEYGGSNDDVVGDVYIQNTELFVVGSSKSNMSIDKSEDAQDNHFDIWTFKISLNDLDCCTSNPAEYQALVSLYNSTNGYQWNNTDGWLEDCDYCEWFGIFCDSNGDVVQIDLSNNNLDGPIIPTFSAFTQLFSVDLSGNVLTGPIPDFTGLSELEWILLQNNMLSGTIPTQIGDIGLEGINISFNNLTGCFPSEIMSICNIGGFDGTSNIDLGNNFVQSWEDFCNGLPCIDPCDSDITPPVLTCPIGTLPIDVQIDGTAIAVFSDFNITATDNCDMQVDISDVNFNLDCSNVGGPAIYTTVTATDDAGNSSTCQVGVQVFDANGFCCSHPDFAGLQAFYDAANGDQWSNTIANNRPWFEDCDPCGILDGTPWYGIACNANNQVTHLGLNFNNLSGIISPDIELITQLSNIVIYDNVNLTGPIPNTICNLNNLIQFYAFRNGHNGTIPTCIGDPSLLPLLTDFQIQNNNIEGEIPPFSNPNLFNIVLNDNLLTGGIPTSLSSLSNLSTVTFNNNLLSGCYDQDLLNLCNSNMGTIQGLNNSSVSDGNMFDATWENFCDFGDGMCTVNTDESIKTSVIVIVPNPVSQNLKLNIEFDYVEVFDVFGNRSMHASNFERKGTIDVSSLSNGAYFINCFYNGELLGSGRFVKIE